MASLPRENFTESAARRRLRAVRRHLLPYGGGVADGLDLGSRVQASAASGELNGRDYSVILPEDLRTGKWIVYRSARSPLKLVSGFADHPNIGTLHDNFEHASETFRDYKYLGTRVHVDGSTGEYKWMTYGEAGSAREAIGSGLRYHGILEGVCVGLYFVNRPEWLIVDHACSAYSYISVPLYDTLGPDAVKYVVNHAAVQAIFCAPQTLNTLLSFLSEIPTVRLIVVVGGIDIHLPSLPPTSRVELISYLKLLSQGCSNLQPCCPPKPENIATICYTSGTTGTPKGVALTHGNLIASVAGFSRAIKFNPSDIYISYLPLAHIYERTNQILSVYYGVAVGFYQGDNMKLMDDLATLRPTIFCSVPRLYNRIYAGIINAVKSSGTLKERLFRVAFNSKKHAILTGQNPSPMWDRLVFNRIKEKLGGQVRFMGSGASPLSPDIMDFLRVCFGCQVLEGYEIKLVDVPEMNYTSEDQPYPRGEICVRGPIVFQGYYNDEVQTREVIDDGSWLHTGDIGLWLPGGRLKIIDRKKNIFKLAQGEYIAPEKIENVYSKCKFISQCFVYGDSLNSYLVAVVTVDPEALKEWAASQDIKYEALEQLCNDRRAQEAVLAEMDAIGREAELRGFEYVKAVTLVLEPFTVENGLLTPTFKIKRPQAKAHFAKAISDMYTELSTSNPSPDA
ncbi:hypothetical protein NL676_020169 [Syzygium grande]|nr:hypothetical protein NL676_020169 [Syzygium grande]